MTAPAAADAWDETDPSNFTPDALAEPLADAPPTAEQLRSRAQAAAQRAELTRWLDRIEKWLRAGPLPEATLDEVMAELEIIRRATAVGKAIYVRRYLVLRRGKHCVPRLTNKAMGAVLGVSDVQVVKTLDKPPKGLAEFAEAMGIGLDELDPEPA